MTGRGEPIRVCLVTQRWTPSFSGAAHRFRQYIPGFRERGIEVDVVCSTAPGDESPETVRRWNNLGFGEIMPVEEAEGTSVHRVKLPAGRTLRRNRLYHGTVIKHLGTTRANVAQFLTLEPLRTHRGSALSRTGVAGVFTGTLMSKFSGNPVKRVLQRQWIRTPIQTMDHVVVSSEVMRSYFESLGVTKPITIIPNGVDLERFRVVDSVGEQKTARDLLGLPTAADIIVFVGSIIHRKGVDALAAGDARGNEGIP